VTKLVSNRNYSGNLARTKAGHCRYSGRLDSKSTAAMLKFLQINIDRRENAQDLKMAVSRERGADVLIISGPHHCGQENRGWFSDIGSKVAISVVNPKIQVQEIGLTNNTGFCWARLEDTTVYACYWFPQHELHYVRRLSCQARRQRKKQKRYC